MTADIISQTLGDLASTVGILTGIFVGFKWLSRQLESWIKREVQDEVKKAVHEEMQSHEHRLVALEAWMGGFRAARVEVHTIAHDEDIMP